MKDYVFLPEDTVNDLTSLVKRCMIIEPTCGFVLVDSEGSSVLCDNAEEILTEMDGGDEEYSLEVRKNGKRIGWFGILPYESDGVGYDYGCNQFTERVMNDRYIEKMV